MKRTIRAALVALTIALAGVAGSGTSVLATTEHCADGGTGHIENGAMDNDLVLPAGTVGCVKGSTDAVNFIADGVTDLFTYLGNGHDVSYYVIYQYPEATPSPTPEPTPTPAPTATPSPTPSPSTEPSESPEPSSTPQPSSTPSDSPSATPRATLPPTDTAYGYEASSTASDLPAYVIGFVFIISLAWAASGFPGLKRS